MRLIPEAKAAERASSTMELPTHFDHLSTSPGLARFASVGCSEGDQKRRRNSMLRRAAVMRFSPVVSTEQCNRDDDAPFRGPYAHLRKQLDYSYHVPYRKERQWLQDSIVEDILESQLPEDFSACVTPTEPWLVFTVGPRGAGKKHVLKTLAKDGKLPLITYVRIDPDEIRRRLPEFDTYSSKNPCLVDELTRKESGFIAELLLLAALQNGRNVVLDGSMSDPSWHMRLIQSLRRQYQSLKFATILITAPIKTLLSRAKKKFRDTGRDVTQDAVVSYINHIEESVETVRPFVDFSCKIHNGEGPIELVGMEWQVFCRTFLQTCAWKPDTIGKHRTIHELTKEEVNASLHVNMQHIRRKHRRFSASISSEENNRADDMTFYGKYSHIRETIDYSYHSNYTFERQKLQDAIIDDMLDAALILDIDGKVGSVPTEPWIVFTAGAMGAGKSHTMNVLVEKGRFPLNAFVTVDPDEIRHLLPEYHMYIDENPELAGELTRKEAGFIAEILTLSALQAGKNVLQDGSLRDSDWYKVYFARLRKEFPHVRQAILHVTAPHDEVFRRAKRRAETTGRVVPMEVLEAALEQVPRSVAILSPIVDYYAELNNSASDVELVKPEGSSWEDFTSVWKQRVAYEKPKKRSAANI